MPNKALADGVILKYGMNNIGQTPLDLQSWEPRRPFTIEYMWFMHRFLRVFAWIFHSHEGRIKVDFSVHVKK